MEKITSVQNPLIKQLAKLRTVAGRKAQGMFLIEGYKLCEEALRSAIKIKYCLYYPEDLAAAAIAAQCPEAQCVQVSAHIIDKLSDAACPQQIVMAAEIPSAVQAVVDAPLLLALDGISDPANLGAILRSAEAFGIEDIFCSRETVDLYNTKVLRGAMGSSFRVRVHSGDLGAALEDLRVQGYRIIASFLAQDALPIQQIDTGRKTVIVIGNEAHGVSPQIVDRCDGKAIIPMAGRTESLNAAVAAAIFMWHFYGK